MRERKHFHNTTNEPLQIELKYDELAKSQENAVYEYLRVQHNTWFTADQLHSVVWSPDRNIPITSTRRALSNLKREGKIIKSLIADGVSSYNRACYTWTLK